MNAILQTAFRDLANPRTCRRPRVNNPGKLTVRSSGYHRVGHGSIFADPIQSKNSCNWS